MNTPIIPNDRRRAIFYAAAAAILTLGTLTVFSQSTPVAKTTSAAADKASTSPEADKAWRDAQRAAQPPGPAPEWRDKRPSADEVAKYYGPMMVKAADAFKDFYTRFPEHPKAPEARKKEYALLTQAATSFGDTSVAPRLAVLDKERLNDPKLSDDEKFDLRLAAVRRLLRNLPESETEAEQTARALRKDFPKRPEPYQVLLMIASGADPERRLALAKEVTEGDAPEALKAQATGILKRGDALGKPLDIKFTAVDGRKVDLAELKGKVVLVDFWATWCGPCVGEMPHVKEAYTKLHEKGFEIVGISFDQDKDALEKFVKRENVPWPQYFNGQGWQNKYGQEYGIEGIPTMWLVDKNGNLHDMEARGELEAKVTKLLVE